MFIKFQLDEKYKPILTALANHHTDEDVDEFVKEQITKVLDALQESKVMIVN